MNCHSRAKQGLSVLDNTANVDVVDFPRLESQPLRYHPCQSVTHAHATRSVKNLFDLPPACIIIFRTIPATTLNPNSLPLSNPNYSLFSFLLSFPHNTVSTCSTSIQISPLFFSYSLSPSSFNGFLSQEPEPRTWLPGLHRSLQSWHDRHRTSSCGA
jgi:hypothetical protein